MQAGYSETLLQPLDIFAIQTIIFLQAITLFISRELKNCSEEGKTMMSCDAFKAYEYIFKLQVRHWMSLTKDNFIAQKTKAFVVCFFPIAHSSKTSN